LKPKKEAATPAKSGKPAKADKDERDEAPARAARPGATREPAKKPKSAPAPASEVFSGKGRRTAPTIALDAYVPGKVCPNLCADKGCPTLIQNSGYCRLFYIKNWSLIQRKRQILGDGQLTRYIEEIVLKYPEKYLEAVRGDLASHDAFQKIVSALELETETDVPGADDEDFEEVLYNIKPAIDDESFE
jgi:hypothetical protein